MTEEIKEIELIQTKFNDIYEFSRNAEGRKNFDKIECDNYFYIKDEEVSYVINLIDNNIERNSKYEYISPSTESGFKSIYNENVTKIIPIKYEWWKISKLLKEKKVQTYEYDIDIYLKYLIHNKRSFSNNRKVGLIDIETDMCRDALRAPEPITSITIFDYETSKYYTWIWSKSLIPEKRLKENEIVYFFTNELAMMEDFLNKFCEFDFSIVGGWYSNDFDWPYIINRLNRLKLDSNKLSKFGEVNSHSFVTKGNKTCYEVIIFGLELVDFIPVLQKNTCYLPQPNSWSLESCAKFYLKDMIKLTDIGANAWKTDVNMFITYNIKDVELVKEIVDKFKLLDFLYVIQREIVPVPLRHTTHNSIVLLYYLKMNYPEVILPDNLGEFNLDGDIINLYNEIIKIKAAYVMEVTEGIHEDVSVGDFSGMYPSIVRTFNISPDTINDTDGLEIEDIVMWRLQNKEIINEYNFKKKFKQDIVGVYPKMLKELTERRTHHKKLYKKYAKEFGEEDIRTKLELFKTDVRKQQNNSLFGVNSYNKFNVFNPFIGAAITSIGREIIKFVIDYINSKEGFKAILSDTDSVFFSRPKGFDGSKFEEEVNLKLKDYVLNKYKMSENRYCLFFEFEHTKNFKKFVTKPAKKRYYGILENGEFYIKGFDIVTHTISSKIKIMLQELYLMLLDKKSIEEMRNVLKEYRKQFNKLKYEDIGIEWKISDNLEDYKTKVRHIEAAKYSNKYLKTEFRAGTVGKLIFIKQSLDLTKYPITECLLLDSNTNLPQELMVDYDVAWEKLIIDKIKLLEDVEEMKIKEVLNPNKTLGEFF